MCKRRKIGFLLRVGLKVFLLSTVLVKQAVYSLSGGYLHILSLTGFVDKHL
jgi:hypothetical protein